jgi:thiamine pyrophosphate-dependent acetolactate synthase large subunit-like protein
MKMTTEEAFVKVLQMHGIEHAFGIIGSAFMPISDLFPQAGITFWDVAHESNGGLICDGYTRSTGKMAMAIAQNGPGITGFVTPVKTAYWNHTPMLLVTPQAANKTIGQGGFQEVEQMALFRDMVCYQEEVRDVSRVAEVLNRVILKAKRLSAPAQINIPRDFWTQVIDINLPAIVEFERPAGGDAAVTEAAKLLSEAKFLSSCQAPASYSETRSRCVRLWLKSSTRQFATTTSTTTAFRAVTDLLLVRLATTGQKRQWNSLPKPTSCWRSGPGSIRFRRFPAMASTTGPRPRKLFRSISTPIASA